MANITHYLCPTAEILSGKNARAWVSMVSFLINFKKTLKFSKSESRIPLKKRNYNKFLNFAVEFFFSLKSCERCSGRSIYHV